MAESKIIQAVKRRLFSNQSADQVFAILDGASIPNLLPNLADFEPEYVCLYRGEIAPDIAEVAPYLVMLERDTQFIEWIIDNGWGKHWGIFGASPVGLATLRRHFRKFLTIYNPAGKSMFFRYYDPRVLQIYLPTCNEKELQDLFGPAIFFFLEKDISHCGLILSLIAGKLVVNDVSSAG
jgi:hypothetical protein